MRRRRIGTADRNGDPLDGIVNLFDVAIVLAVGFLLAALTGAGISDLLTSKNLTIVTNPGYAADAGHRQARRPAEAAHHTRRSGQRSRNPPRRFLQALRRDRRVRARGVRAARWQQPDTGDDVGHACARCLGSALSERNGRREWAVPLTLLRRVQ